MDGHDKISLVYRGLTLLDRTIASSEGAGTIVCVGPERPTSFPVTWTREVPAGGGPVAGLAAGLELIEAPIVVVLAADLPLITADVVRKLVDLCPPDGGAVVVDGGGRQQFLLGAYDTAAVRAVLRSMVPEGASMRSLVADLTLEELRDERAAADIDTWADVDALLEQPRTTLQGDGRD